MSEDFSLKIGISADTDGAKELSDALDKLAKKADESSATIERLEESLKRMSVAQDGTKIIEHVRVLDDAAESTDDLASATDRLRNSLKESGMGDGSEWSKVTKILKDLSYTQSEISKDWIEFKNDADSAADAVAIAFKKAENATGGFRLELNEAVKAMADVGDIAGASRLAEISDQFANMEKHIASVLTPGSELMRQFGEAAGMTAGDVQDLYTTYGRLLAEVSETQLQFEAGKITLEQYVGRVHDIEESIQSVIPGLYDLREQLQLGTNAGDAADEISGMIEKLGEAPEKMNEFADSQNNASNAGEILNNSMTTLGVSLGKLNGTLLNAIGITGISATLYKAFTASNDMTNSLAKMANMADLADEDVARLKDRMKGLASEFTNSSNEEAVATLTAMSKGYRDIGSSLEIVAQANKLADATFSDVSSSADALSQALAAFNMGAEDAEQTFQELTVAAGGSAEAMQQIAALAGRLGAVMTGANIKFKDYALAVATLKQGGMDTRKAVMNLTQTVATLSNVGVKYTLLMEKAGVVINNQRIAAEGLIPILKELYYAADGNKDKIAEMTGSMSVATTVMAVMRDEGELLEKSVKNMGNAAEIAAKDIERVNNTFSKQFSNLSSQVLEWVKSLVSGVGDKLVPILKYLNKNIGLVIGTIKAMFAVFVIKTAFSFFTGMATAAAAASTKLGLVALKTGLSVNTMGAQSGLAARGLGVLAGGATRAAAAVGLLGRALTFLAGPWGILIGLVITAISVIGAYASSTDAAAASIKTLEERTMDYTKTLRGLNSEQLKSEVNNVEADVRSNTEALKEQSKAYADLLIKKDAATGARATVTSGGMFGVAPVISAVDTTQIDSAARRMQELSEKSEELSERLATAKERLKDTVEEESRAIGLLSNKDRDAVQQMIDSYSKYSLPAKLEELNKLYATVKNDPVLLKEPEKQSRYLDTIRRNIEETTIALKQFNHEKTPTQQYMDTLTAGASAAGAATVAWKDKLRDLKRDLGEGAISVAEYKDQVTKANIEFSESIKMARIFSEEHRGITQEVNPASKAMDDYADAAVKVSKALAGGLDADIATEYMRQQNNVLLEGIALAALRADAEDDLLSQFNEELKIADELTAAYMKAWTQTSNLIKDETERARVLGILTEKLREQAVIQTELANIQKDTLLQLMAKYDPVIALEVRRTEELIRAKEAIWAYTTAEDERKKLLAEVSGVINNNFDREAAGLKKSQSFAEAWKTAWQSAIERIDGMFASLWESAFKGMDDFKKSFKATLKSMAAEVLHSQITRPLVAQLGALFSKQPAAKPGQVFSGGLMEAMMAKLTGAQQTAMGGAGIMSNAKTAYPVMKDATRDGVIEAMNGGNTFSKLGDGLLSSFSDAFSTFGGDLSSAVSKLGSAGETISEGWDRLMSPESFGNAFTKLFKGNNGLQGILPGEWDWMGGGGNSTIPGASGGWMSKIGDVIGRSFGKVFGKLFGGGGGEFADLFGGSGRGIFSNVIDGVKGLFSKGAVDASGLETIRVTAPRMVRTASGAFAPAGTGAASPMMAAAPYAAAAFGAYYGYKNSQNSLLGGLGYGALGGVAGYTALGAYGAATTAAGIASAAGATGLTAAGATAGAAGTGGLAALQSVAGMGALGPIAIALAVAAVVDLISGGKLFGTKYRPEKMETSFGVKAGETFATQVRTDVKEQALFGGTKRRKKEMTPTDEAVRAAEEMYTQIFKALRDGAKRLGVEIPKMLDASFTSIVKFDKNGKIKKGKTKNTLTIDGREYKLDKDMENAQEEARSRLNSEAMVKVIAEAFPDVSRYVEKWRKNAGDLASAVESLSSIFEAIKGGGFNKATKEWEDSQKTQLALYYEEVEALNKSIAANTNSLLSLEDLAQATQKLSEAQYELGKAYYSVREAASEMFKDTAQSIRESLMTPEELYSYRKNMAESLAVQLGSETDPRVIERLTQQINSLVNSAYGSLDESQRTVMAPEFLTFVDGVETIMREQIQMGLDDLGESARDVDDKIYATLTAGLTASSAAAATMATAAQQFNDSVGLFGNIAERIAAIVAAQRTATTPTTTTAPASVTYTAPSSGRIGLDSLREVNA
jgi:hypothetical protein